MHESSLDDFDIAILSALQRDGSLTNASLSKLVNLSPSQCSRRRSALEASGIISGYNARLDPGKLGVEMRAFVRVNLKDHGKTAEEEFTRFISAHAHIRGAFSVSGDSDYILDVRMANLAAFAEFVHEHLLPHPRISHVRSEIVLKSMKDETGISLV